MATMKLPPEELAKLKPIPDAFIDGLRGREREEAYAYNHAVRALIADEGVVTKPFAPGELDPDTDSLRELVSILATDEQKPFRLQDDAEGDIALVSRQGQVLCLTFQQAARADALRFLGLLNFTKSARRQPWHTVYDDEE